MTGAPVMESFSLTAALVDRLSLIEEYSISADERRTIRALLLDYIAVCAEGSRSESASAMCRSAMTIAPSGAMMPVIGAGHDLPGTAAAMVNAVAGHTTEFDDVHNASSSHPGVVIFSALFGGVAQTAEIDDASMLKAVIIGYEAMCRVGRAANPAAQYARHFHPTATVGAIGAAATASRLLRLSRTQTVWSLGIAADLAAGGLQFLVDGAWTKRLHPAIAARNGLDAALLAAEGFVGTEDGIGGEHGFLATYTDSSDRPLLLAGWPNSPLEVTQTSIKAHACCRYKQGPIDALIAIRVEHHLEISDVQSIEIGLPTVAIPIVAEPTDAKRRPKSVVDAQFSMAFGAAVAIVHGRAGPREYVQEALNDDRILALMDRVMCVGDPSLDVEYPRRWRSWVQVTTRSGSVYRMVTDEPKGDPGNPLTTAELAAKFNELAEPVYDDATRVKIVDAVGHFGEPGAFQNLVVALRSTRPDTSRTLDNPGRSHYCLTLTQMPVGGGFTGGYNA
ncbi:MAG: MmgE/PrpD family protein [Ilumatobacteraceae bacterium]